MTNFNVFMTNLDNFASYCARETTLFHETQKESVKAGKPAPQMTSVDVRTPETLKIESYTQSTEDDYTQNNSNPVKTSQKNDLNLQRIP